MGNRTLLRNASIFNSLKGKVNEGQSLLIEAGKISWVGPEGDMDVDSDMNTIDCEDKMLLPGLMDAHVHLAYPKEWMENPEKSTLRNKTGLGAFYGLHYANRYLANGVTTVRDCGSRYELAHLREAFQRNLFPGPNLLVAQTFLRQWGNQEGFGPDHYLEADKAESISGVDEVIRAVRDRKFAGSDFIKTMTTGGVLHGKESDVSRSLWREDELRAMVTEAERLGMYVACHAHGAHGVTKAVEAGARTIEHASHITEETADLLASKPNSYIVATHSPQLFLENERMREMANPEIIEKGRRVLKLRDNSHKIAYEKGAKFVCGTDAPVGGDHCHTAKEIELMHHNIGMTSIEALQSATSMAAEALKIDDRFGSLTEGKFADLILVDGNPVDDLTILQNPENILHVFKSGRLVATKGKLV